MSKTRQNDFAEAARHVFNSKEGKLVLAYLKEEYLDISAIAETPELTYYRLGQKELIQLLIQHLHDDTMLEEVRTHPIQEEYEI